MSDIQDAAYYSEMVCSLWNSCSGL
jgi:hypothetical protein